MIDSADQNMSKKLFSLSKQMSHWIVFFDVGRLLFTMDIWMRSLAFISMRWH